MQFNKILSKSYFWTIFFLISFFSNNLVYSEEINLKLIENYLNSISSIDSEIIQFDQNGNKVLGSIKLKKPGKLRIEYFDKKTDHLIVGSGGLIAIIDYNSNAEPQRYPTNGTPLKFLSEKNINLDDNEIKSYLKIYENYVSLEISEKNPKMGLGKIILKFQKDPIKIKGWEIPLNKGQSTEIVLKKTNINKNLEDSLFWISAEVMKFKTLKNLK